MEQPPLLDRPPLLGPPLSTRTDASAKHSDWEVALIASVTVATGPAGRGGLFEFRNGSYSRGCPSYWGQTDITCIGLTYNMLFLGAGVGADLAARMAGRSAAQAKPSGLFKKWHKIDCDQPFSAMDLDGSLAQVNSLTLGIWDIVLISAGPPVARLFHSQSVSGWGIGLGGALTAGNWVYAF